MAIGSLLIFVALLLLVGLYISRPLFENRSVAVSQAEHDYSALLAERDRTLDSIRELDMDYTMGKISPDDYSGQREVLVGQGAEILRQLDRLNPQPSPPEAVWNLEEVSGIPAEGQSQAATALPLPPEFDYDLENLVSARRQSKSGKAAGFCHRCGQPIQQKDRFCSRCGATA